jgi:hypothetical protein
MLLSVEGRMNPLQHQGKGHFLDDAELAVSLTSISVHVNEMDEGTSELLR